MLSSGRIELCMSELKKKNRSGLFPFVTAGDPDLDFTKSLIKSLASSGADGMEIGVPFSDPLADGPTIQASSHRSLKVCDKNDIGNQRRIEKFTDCYYDLL